MSKVLITGGAGYIGSTLTRMLLERDNEVTVIDNLMYGQSSLTNLCLYKTFNFIEGDVRDEDLLEEQVKKHDVIIPLAAIVGFPACEKDKELATAVNYKHVWNICKWSSPDKKLIYPNTNSGYGVGEGDTLCTEETPLSPISHYGNTKCNAEANILSKGGISLRLATVFGMSPRFRNDLLVNDFVYRAFDDGFIVLFEKHFKRNFVHVVDVCDAFIYMINNYDKAKGEAYNVGLSSANLSKLELCEKIKEYVPNFAILSDDINTDPDKRNYIVSSEKIEKLGCKARVSLDDGIQELLKAYPMIRKVKNSNYTNL